MYFSGIDEIKDYGNLFQSPEASADNNELLQLFETHLNGEERSIYIKVKSGIKVSKADMDKLTIVLKEIVKNYG
jgi:hypothetical protein